jgi:hypothetical protein
MARSTESLMDKIEHLFDLAVEEAVREAVEEAVERARGEVLSTVMGDLRTGLELIDKDRAAAKVYLERAIKDFGGNYLMEIAPCL